MLSSQITLLSDFLTSKFAWVIKGKFWVLKSVLFCTLLSLIFSFPRLERFFYSNAGLDKDLGCSFLMKQVNNPFDKSIYDGIDIGSHHSKRVFRITVPILANLFHLNVLGIYVMQLIIGILGLAAFLILTNKIFDDRMLSFLFLVSLTSTLTGKIWYLQFASYFDGISIAFLLFAFLSSSFAPTILFSLLAFFNDERSLLGILPILLTKTLNDKKISVKPILPIIFAIVGYIAIRLCLQHFFKMRTPVGESAGFSIEIIKRNLWAAQYSFLKVFEGFWIILIYASGLLFKYNRYYFYLWLIIFSLILIGSLTILDVDRSLTYGVCLLIFCFAALKKYNKDQKTTYDLAILTTIVCLLVPSNSFIGNYWGIYASNFFLVELFRIVQAMQGHIFQY